MPIPIAYIANPSAKGNLRERHGKINMDKHENTKFNDLARIV